MQCTITVELDQRSIDWMRAEVELNKLYNEVDAAIEREDYESASELGDQAIPLANSIIEMGFNNEDAFRLLLLFAENMTVESVNDQ